MTSSTIHEKSTFCISILLNREPVNAYSRLSSISLIVSADSDGLTKAL
jgi:hypothetical protein